MAKKRLAWHRRQLSCGATLGAREARHKSPSIALSTPNSPAGLSPGAVCVLCIQLTAQARAACRNWLVPRQETLAELRGGHSAAGAPDPRGVREGFYKISGPPRRRRGSECMAQYGHGAQRGGIELNACVCLVVPQELAGCSHGGEPQERSRQACGSCLEGMG